MFKKGRLDKDNFIFGAVAVIACSALVFVVGMCITGAKT